jgi:hypothetical protein
VDETLSIDTAAPPDDPPRPLPAWRGWVNEQLTRAEELRLAHLATYEETQKREHLKTRVWVLLVTAPAWGDFTASVFKSLSPVESTVGGMLAVLAGAGLMALRGVLRGGS